MPIDLKIGKLVNRTVWQPDRNQVVIDQTLELECDCGTTIIIEQHIDGMTMIEGVRHPITAGKNTLSLKQMRIVNPRTVRPDGEPAFYDLAVRVYAVGLDPILVSESVSFLNLIKDHS
jgi:hypothetical protein